MKSSTLLAIIIAITAVLWIGSGLVGPFATGPKEDTAAVGDHAEKKIESVRVMRSSAQDYTKNVILTGRSHPYRSVILRAETDGPVKEILVDRGKKVYANDILAVLDAQERDVSVTEAQKLLAQREIEYEAAQSLQQKGFNSKTTLASTRTDLEGARRMLKAATLEIDRVSIKAPFEGIVDERYIEIGDFVQRGADLYKMVDLDPLKLVGFVSERNVAYLNAAASAQIRFLNGEVATGKVSFVAKDADPDTRTFKVEIYMPNANYTYRSGLTAEMRIPSARVKAHRISPAILALDDDGEIGVKIVDAQNKVQFQKITILADEPDSMWILGLPEQANIIVVGQDYVIPGQTVKPVFEDKAG